MTAPNNPMPHWRAVNPRAIAGCSPRHVQSVLENAQRDMALLEASHAKLLDAAARALPFVEDAEKDTAYKPGAVRQMVNTLRAAVATGDALKPARPA